MNNCQNSEIEIVSIIEELEEKCAPGHIKVGPLTIVWDD